LSPARLDARILEVQRYDVHEQHTQERACEAHHAAPAGGRPSLQIRGANMQARGSRKSVILIFALVSILLAPRTLWAQSGDGYVGVFGNAAGTQACTSVPQYTQTTLHIIAKTSGGSASGISGAEFRIEILNPAGWYFTYNAPSGGGVVLGNPLDTSTDPNDNSGLNINFPTCVEPSSGNIPLGTISVFNVSGSPTTLLVKRHNRPSNPGYQCPLFVTCNAPVYSKLCMSTAAPDSCSLGTQKTRQELDGDPTVFVGGLNGSAPESGTSAMFAPITSFAGRLPVFTPWSPTGTRLALCLTCSPKTDPGRMRV